MGSGSRLWSEIDSALVGVLVDDVLAVWNDLAPIVGELPVVTPVINPAIALGVGSAILPPGPGLGVASGGLDMTRRDTVGFIQGGPIGERQREINETVQTARLYSVGSSSRALRISSILLPRLPKGLVIACESGGL
ncbi:MAG: hypothetical protein E6J42_02455 [Chloroflexi bacterium]|nr:MAG: hypothetical protein E6J42_02455 [Chloroflexota bacterium]